MAHEIYYTSAPEGLRPGDRGFCTVAATEGIPRQLWDRLEALSGYRHNPDGKNPVALAHWTLALSGQNYHVLSRVVDAGLDYTQRTNSFAHHVVLDASELAAGGPAYMLSQFGVFEDRWNGRVGPIVRRNLLPRGDISPRVCSSWQSATGDAGWAGVVAQALATSPWKPIGLIFSPEQEILPLIAEATALLPPASRWQVTFNTYFTSLPGGMTCQWRCCLAGSPTAATVRAASGGLAIDLTRRDGLGPPPDGPWTEAARTGRVVSTATKTPPSPPTITPPKISLPPAKPSAIQPPSENPTSPERYGRTEKPVVIQRGGLLATEQVAENQSTPVPEFSWMAERRAARRRQLMIVYAIAVVVIGAGLWLSFWAYHTSAERPLPPPASMPIAVAPPPPASEPTAVPPPVVVREPAPIVEKPPATVPVAVAPAPVAVIPPPPPPPLSFEIDALPALDAGHGLASPVSSVTIPTGKLDHPDAIAQLFIAFPDGARQWQSKQADLDGIFVQTDGKSPHPNVQIKWRDTAGLAPPTLIAIVRYAKPNPVIDVTWNNNALLKTPLVSKLCYWVLQNSTLIVADESGRRTQRITFSNVPLKPLRITDPDFANALPVNLPLPPLLKIEKSIPEGWLQGAASDGSKKDADVIPLRAEKPPGRAGMIPGFTLAYSPSRHTLVCDLAKVQESAKADLDLATAESNKAKTEIQQIRDNFQPGTVAIEQSIKDWTAKKDKAVAAPQPGELTPEQIQGQIDKFKADLSTQDANLSAALAPATAKQKDADERAAAINEAISAYAELKELDVEMTLPPQGLHVGTVRLTRDVP